MNDLNEWIVCSCCGASIRNTAEENVGFGEVPYPHDQGTGMCRNCGGDDRIDAETDFKRRIGWAMCVFFEARFDLFRTRLSETNRAKWDALSYEKRCNAIARAVHKGLLV